MGKTSGLSQMQMKGDWASAPGGCCCQSLGERCDQGFANGQFCKHDVWDTRWGLAYCPARYRIGQALPGGLHTNNTLLPFAHLRIKGIHGVFTTNAQPPSTRHQRLRVDY